MVRKASSSKQAYLLPLPRFMHRHSLARRSWGTVCICWTVQYKELGIKTMGNMLTIHKLTKEPTLSTATHVKPPTVKLSQLNSEMTLQQFQKFRINWDMFTKMINISTVQTKIPLYSCANEVIQNSIINTYPEFFNMNPNKLLDMLEVLVMQKSNPMVHQISFSSIVQSDNGPIKNYLVQLRSGAQDCNFICPNWNHDLSSIYIKDQAICGIANDLLLVDILAKAGSLKTLEQNISHAKAFEITMWDLDKISYVSDVAGLWMLAYHWQKWAQSIAWSTATHRREKTMM